jgi:hypothetical protein
LPGGADVLRGMDAATAFDKVYNFRGKIEVEYLKADPNFELAEKNLATMLAD